MAIDEGWDQSGLVGKLVAGKYLLARSLHQGPHSEVFEAEHTGEGERVAVKVLRTHPAVQALDAHVRARRKLERFEHPNIVEVIDTGRLDNGELYVTSTFVRGSTLATDVALEPKRALEIARQLVQALRLAHERGIVYRNLRPEHVLVTPALGRDQVLLLGVAFAQMLPAKADSYADPNYIAPEYVLGTTSDARSDLYSVGALLFQLLTGHPVFHAKGGQALMRLHAYAPAQTLAQRAPERRFTRETEQLVARALEKQPAQRFASAVEMLAAIDAAIASVEEADAAAVAASTPAAMHDASLAKLAADLMPQHTAAPPPVIPMNVERTVPALPWWMRVSKKLRLGKLDHKRRLALAGGVSLLLAITLVIVVATGGRDEPASPHAQSIERSAALLAEGKPYDAATLLAREIRGTTATAPQLIALLQQLLDSSDPRAGLLALDVATRVSPYPADLVLAQAAKAPLARVRHRAVELAETAGLAGRIDRVASWSLDLEQSDDCDEQRELIGKLAATNDRRALPALRKAAKVACVAGEASDAIAKLGAK